MLSTTIKASYEAHSRESHFGLRYGGSCRGFITKLSNSLARRSEDRLGTVICFTDYSSSFDSGNRRAVESLLIFSGVKDPLAFRLPLRVRSSMRPFVLEVYNGISGISVVSFKTHSLAPCCTRPIQRQP